MSVVLALAPSSAAFPSSPSSSSPSLPSSNPSSSSSSSSSCASTTASSLVCVSASTGLTLLAETAMNPLPSFDTAFSAVVSSSATSPDSSARSIAALIALSSAAASSSSTSTSSAPSSSSTSSSATSSPVQMPASRVSTPPAPAPAPAPAAASSPPSQTPLLPSSSHLLTQQQMGLAKLPHGVQNYNDPAMAETLAISLLPVFLGNCVQEWSRFPKTNAVRFNLFDDFISCVHWEGRHFVTGTDIVKFITWRFKMEGESFGEQKKFEEGIFSDLRNLKPGSGAVLEEPRSPFLEHLFKIGAIRTHKKQKVFFWESVQFEKLYKEASRRSKRREFNPAIDSLLSLGTNTDSPRDGSISPRGEKRQRMGDYNLTTTTTSTTITTTTATSPPPLLTPSLRQPVFDSLPVILSGPGSAFSYPLPLPLPTGVPSGAAPSFYQAPFIQQQQQQQQQQPWPFLPPLNVALPGLVDTGAPSNLMENLFQLRTTSTAPLSSPRSTNASQGNEETR